MGLSNSKKKNPIDVNSDVYLIDGRKGETGSVFIGINNLADFVFDHRFIYVDCPGCNHYKIYEWTKYGLKMFASHYYPINESQYLGEASVKDVYKIANKISIGKAFSLSSFNCKDWVALFEQNFNHI